MKPILVRSFRNYRIPLLFCLTATWFFNTQAVKAQETLRSSEPSYLAMACHDLVLQQWKNTDKSNVNDLCTGDRLLAWDGNKLSSDLDLVRFWQSKNAGSTSMITVEREMASSAEAQPEVLKVPFTHQGASTVYADMGGPRTQFRKAAEIHPAWETIDLPLRDAALFGLGDAGDAPLIALHAAFARFTDSVTGHYRNDECVYLMNRPFQAEVWARKFIEPLAVAEDAAAITQLAWRMAEPQGQPLPSLPAIPALEADTSFEQAIIHLEGRLQQIDETMSRALTPLDEQERQQLVQWCRNFRPLWKGDARWDSFVAGLQLTKKMDAQSFALCIALSGRLLRDIAPGGEIHKILKANVSSAPTGTQSPFTCVLDAGDNQHSVETDIVIDLGGNDVYSFPPRANTDTRFRSQILIDLDGDDIYINRGGGLASAIGSTSLLVDSAGDDQYTGENNSLGFALLGMGVLWDATGQDTYQGNVFTQGAGACGIGLLVDRAGNDRYDAVAYAQGIGLPAGFGAILDRSGDDVYCGTGGIASSYGDEGEYEGWCQGCGWGFRGAACGGIGLLSDNQGRDFYRAGQFGLGCGYFYGVGLVHDRQGDDVFECSRYGLGTAAHYAVGMVFDDQGDDQYSAQRRSAVAEMGSGWDLAVAVLIDGSGNDVYLAKTYALGGAAQNAWGIFHDKAGRDVYRSAGGAAGEALGYVGGATYGGGRLAGNLALFLDEGHEDDTYLAPGRTNQNHGKSGEIAIWIDR